MKIALFTDLHLGIKSDSPEWHEIAYNWVDSMVSRLKENNIKDIFFLGDWFHNRTTISVETLYATSTILDKLKDFTLWIFPGNHDLYYANKNNITALKLFKGYPNINYFDNIKQIELNNKKITLCPWGTNPLDDEIEPSDYLFAHIEINTFNFNSTNLVCENGYTLSDLLKKFPKIFSGHFHKAQKKLYTDGYIQYIGNPFQQNFGENDNNKGFTILDLDTGIYKQIKNDVSPKFIKIKLSDLIKIQLNQISEVFENNFINLNVDKNITRDDMGELQLLLSSCKPREITIDWDASYNNDISNETFSVLEFLTALVNYTKLLEVDNETDVIKYLTNLYNTINEERSI